MQQNVTPESPFGLDTQLLLGVLATGDAAQRVSLARQVAAFLASESSPAREREQIVPVALALAAHDSIEVRKALAEGLTTFAGLHADLLFAIIADVEEVALPFLARTPALNTWHMIAVLQVGDDARRAAVAMREDISPEAIDFIIDKLPFTISALLLENPKAAFTERQMRALHDRFSDVPEVIEPLLAKLDLPLDVRIRHARLVASRLRTMVSARGWLPADDAAELVADVEETAALDILMRAGGKALAPVVGRLIDQELLTPSIIVRAACHGAMDIVQYTLAQLSGMSARRAREFMTGKAIGGFRSLHAKAGLPQSCYWTLQAACDVAREVEEEGVTLDADAFGRRMIEVLLTRYEAMPLTEHPRNLEVVSRFAADRARLVAQQLKADLLKAA